MIDAGGIASRIIAHAQSGAPPGTVATAAAAAFRRAFEAEGIPLGLHDAAVDGIRARIIAYLDQVSAHPCPPTIAAALEAARGALKAIAV